MAIMIPSQMEEDNHSYGEKEVFNALKKLPDDYTVFHSLSWNKRNEYNYIEWGESDFTVAHPQKGIIVIEVKSGKVECVNNTWTYIRFDNNERHSMKNPLRQANRSVYKFLDIVNDILHHDQEDVEENIRNDYERCIVESAVWFPSIDRKDVIGELPIDYAKEIVLYESALIHPQKFIDGIYEYYNSERKTRLSKSSYDKIINTFAPHYNAVPSLRSKHLMQQEMFIRLTQQQNSLLDYLDEQRVAAIQGSAGTGKTVLAIEKAKRLSTDGKVLFLCFNQFLKNHLQDIKDSDPDTFHNIDFYNLHQLACKKLKTISVDKNDIYDFLYNFENYNWDYKHIIIDEGQDFDENEILKLNEIALLNDGAFYIFYDKNQFVQGREFPEWLKNSECRLVLNINCRNTYNIALTAGKSIGIPPNIKNKNYELHKELKGEQPKLYYCNDKKSMLDIMDKIISEYRHIGIPYEQISILTTRTENTSIMHGIESIGNHKISTERKAGYMLFTTARKFKGLEAEAILMVDVDDKTFSNIENRRLFYVGTSRAKNFLNIFSVGNNEDLAKFANSLKEGSEDKSIDKQRIAIAKNLSVKFN